MDPVVLLDAAGCRRSAATMPGHRRGQAPRNKGMRYPADPPSVEEIVLVMRHAGDRAHGLRLRGLIVVMWRAGLRIGEALALTESDLDPDRGAIVVRHGKGNKRREVGMDQWGWELLRPWLAYRVEISVGPLFCDIDGRNPWADIDDDQCSSAFAAHGREGRRAAPLRSAPVASRARGRDGSRGLPLNVIQRQLGHANLGITSVYLQGIDNAEIIDTVYSRRAPRQRRSAPSAIARRAGRTPLVCARSDSPHMRRGAGWD